MPSALVPLANLTLTGNQTTVTFSSISQSYRDLLLVSQLVMPTDNGNSFYYRFNGDSGTNYSWVQMRGDGSSIFSNAATTQAQIASAGSISTVPTSAIFSVLDYSATDKHKTALLRANVMWSADPNVMAVVGRWANTAAITSLTIILTGATGFAAGSTFALYGVSA